ncbi:amidohydrolase [Bacteroidota bacterium]
MHDLSVSFIQSDIHWQDHGANLAMFEEKIWQITQSVDLIILPEMFNTGFSMNVEHSAEPVNGRSFKWLRQMSAQTGSVVTGSLIIKEGGRFYNRLVWMNPDGTYSHYDKRHLFRMAEEDRYFSHGNNRIIMNLKGWKICPLICYDLRFPVWSRNRINDDHELEYDLLLYLANWPASRTEVWTTLLKARAIENLCYVIGVSRIGIDGNNTDYNGHSNLIDFKGRERLSWGNVEESKILTLNYQELINFRHKFPAHYDSDSFKIDNI